MFAVVDKVSALGGAYAAFELAHPAIASIWTPLRGLLMPEYFWDYGFEPKDKKRMKTEIEMARRKAKELELKYSYYSTADKLRVEKAYREMFTRLSRMHQAPNPRRTRRFFVRTLVAAGRLA